MNAPAQQSPVERWFTAFFLFCGIGAGALGFLEAQIILNGILGRFRSLGGVDIDPVACRTFERLTKSPGFVEDIATMTAARLRELFGPKAPRVLFLSAPCQGFSGLLSEEKGKAPKYQALNELAVTGLKLVFDAWGDDGPDLIIFENVPRIATRGKALLSRIRKLLQSHGYVTHEGTHNCGRIGALAQSRERFLLVARHARRVPVFLYQPEQHDLRPCGEVLGALPLPTDPSAGRLHALPKISGRTWLRLAKIRPGFDWRDLSTLDGEHRPAWARYAIDAWTSPVGAVAGSGTNSAWGVADVRVPGGAWFRSVLGVVPVTEAFGTITGRGDVTTGAFALADLRFNSVRYGMNMRVASWSAPSWTITGATDIQAGAPSVADVRLRAPANFGCYGVFSFDAPAGTITGNQAPGGSTCNVADLRITCEPWRNSGVLGVLAWSQPSYTVTGALDLWAGYAAVADPRGGEQPIAVFEGVAARVLDRRAARVRGRATVPFSATGGWWVSDPRVPSNPRLAVRWRQVDLDDAPPYLPVIPGRGDGSWHRPITLLERAALQGLPTTIDGAPLELEGTLSQVAKHIGNAVPVGAARPIASEMLRTLILASTGAFMLSSAAGVWVKKRRDGSFPLYVDQQLPRVKRRVRRKVRRAVERIVAATTFCESTRCEGRA